jgi:AraC family transcriptional regulator
VLRDLSHEMVPLRSNLDEVNVIDSDRITLAVGAHLQLTCAGSCAGLRAFKSGLAPWQARRALASINTKLSSNLSVSELAGECCVSPKHFSRAFRLTFGVPPYRMLQERRVAFSKELLLIEGLPLRLVAKTCGLATQSRFNRVFTSFVGLSPGRWRRFMLRTK